MTRRGSYGAGWRWARAMAAVLLVCGLASCGSDGGDNSSAGAAAAVDRSATLRFGWVVEPASLDPHAEPSVGARPYWMPLYDTLFDIGSGEVRPGLATVVIVNVVPWWNDFFFPLLFLPSKTWRTIPLGMQIFFGQHLIDWSLVFSGMLLASLPLLVIYVLMSRQFIAGLTAGAVKG